ncbi:MAG: hypothetical protein IJU48_07715, partial [Synergistaceae bacterium]|nr:hypothetical protein [Synergistaceae bacterium]
QLETLNKEININGNYQEWYEALADFRRLIQSKYIIFKIGRRYRHKITLTSSGDLIDHHIISYLAPLDFKRRGWGNRILRSSEQVIMLANYLKQKNTRLIYIALPNKCNIYPEIICDDLTLLNGKTIFVPQYRKFIRELVTSGVEVIDMLPVFMRHKEDFALFSKDHHVSISGAKLIADTAAEYLRLTTKNITGDFNVDSEEQYIFLDDINDKNTELARVFFTMKDGKRVPFWNQHSDISKIAIFGDCNLQSYTSIGGGISANLSCNLNYPVYNYGRKLIFSECECPLTQNDLERLSEFDIVIYNAFASASFVRSSHFSFRHPLRISSWDRINI